MAELPVELTLNKISCTCLNESDTHKLKDVLNGTGHLESDCDEQLLLCLQLQETVRIHSVLLEGTMSRVKLFVNQLSFDFQNAENEKPSQVLDLTPDQTIKGKGKLIPLKFVNFQKVHTLNLFIDKNVNNDPSTILYNVKLFGFPLKSEGTKMDPSNSVANSRVSATDIKDFYN